LERKYTFIIGGECGDQFIGFFFIEMIIKWPKLDWIYKYLSSLRVNNNIYNKIGVKGSRYIWWLVEFWW